MNFIRVSQSPHRAGGQPQVTFAARAVAGDGHALLAARNQPVEVTEDGRGHFFAPLQDFGFVLQLEWLRVQRKLLQREQFFHDLSHEFALMQRPCRERPPPR